MSGEKKDIYENPLERAVDAFNMTMSSQSVKGRPLYTLEEFERNGYMEMPYKDTEGKQVEARLVVGAQGKFSLIANRGDANALLELSNELTAAGIELVYTGESGATKLNKTAK